jgi:Domain of unknown function (DUF4874)/Domain of unknown function (DUF4832)
MKSMKMCVAITSLLLCFAPVLAQSATPTVSISSSPKSVFIGQPYTITWSSTGATGCEASGAWSGSEALSGSRTITPSASGTLTYSLDCTGAGGSASASAKVAVTTPTLSLTEAFAPNAVTISTSEGAPYGDCDFWVSTPADCNAESNFGYGPTRVMRLYICLSGEVSVFSDCSKQPEVTGPLSSAMLSAMNTRLAAYDGTGMRLLIRFTYNFGPIGPTAMDAPIDVISKNIDQVAPILKSHKDLIFGLEAGFIGTWGEWHDSTNGNDTAAAQKIVLDKELSYFTDLFPILVRYPGDLIQYVGNRTPQPGLGMHDDYYASDSDDGATWNPCDTGAGYCFNNYTQSQFESYGAGVSTTTMFAGEFGALYNTLQTCTALNHYSYTYHPQSISLFPSPADIGTLLQNEGCATTFFNRVGTRIVLQDVTLIGDATPGGKIYLAATMVNDGYGRVIRERAGTLVLIQNSAVVARISIPIADVDLRTLASSSAEKPLTFRFEFTLPKMLASGPVSAALWFRDPAPSLSAQPAYALPLNSLDQDGTAIFDATTGYNQIGTFNVN